MRAGNAAIHNMVPAKNGAFLQIAGGSAVHTTSSGETRRAREVGSRTYGVDLRKGPPTKYRTFLAHNRSMHSIRLLPLLYTCALTAATVPAPAVDPPHSDSHQ